LKQQHVWYWTVPLISYAYLAILFETFGTLAPTPHIVTSPRRRKLHSLFESNTGLEGIGILGTSLLDGLVTNLTGMRSIPTVRAIASRTKTLRSEAFAIQLEAFGLFAIAGTGFWCA
jgi:hypothetical protein